MPFRAASAWPSAVTADRQSTTVPNTSCTSAFSSVIGSSSLYETGQSARLFREAEHAPPVEFKPAILSLAAHIADIDLLDDDRELERGENLIPADRADIEAGARGVTLDGFGQSREAVAPGRHRRDRAPSLGVVRLDPIIQQIAEIG